MAEDATPGSEIVGKGMDDVFKPDHLAVSAGYAFNSNLADSRYGQLPDLAVGTEINSGRHGREPRGDDPVHECGGTTCLPGEDRFQRGMLFGVGALVDVDGHSAVPFRHSAGRYERLNGVEPRNINLPVISCLYLDGHDHVAMDLGWDSLAGRKHARTENLAVAGLEEPSLD